MRNPVDAASSHTNDGGVARSTFDTGWLAFAIVAIVACVVIMRAGHSLTFFFDEWTWITDRRNLSIDTLLVPHNEHLVLVPSLVFWFLFHAVGLEYWPYRFMIALAHVGVAALVFAHLRRRVQWPAALCAAVMVLFCGIAYQVILWPFTLQYVLSLIGVLGLLLLLDRNTRRADAGASALAAIALASSGIGVPLVAVVGIELMMRRTWRRLWVIVVPLSAYTLWFVVYGTRTGKSAGTAATVRWMIEFAGSSVGAAFGLGRSIGEVLLIPFLLIVAWGLRRADPALRPRAVTLVVFPFAYWSVIAFGRAGMQDPDTSRYLYVGAVLVLLALGHCCAGISLRPPAAIAIALLTSFAVFSGTSHLFRGGDELRAITQQTLATMSAIDIGTRTLDPEYIRVRQPPPQDGRPLVAAFDALGSIALSPQQVASRTEEFREQADGWLVAAIGVQPMPPTPPRGAAPSVVRGTQGSADGDSCLRFDPGAGAVDVEIEPRTGYLLVDPIGSSPVDVWFRAFADGWFGAGAPYLTISGHGAADVPTPSTAAPGWHIRLESVGGVRVCGTLVGGPIGP